MANILLSFAILGAAYAWYRLDFRVPARLTPYAEAMRAAVAVIGWVILLGMGGEETAHVVSVSLAEPGVHFFSPYKNADAFWLMITLRVTVALLLGGSLIKMARARSAHARDTAFPDA